MTLLKLNLLNIFLHKYVDTDILMRNIFGFLNLHKYHTYYAKKVVFELFDYSQN